MNARKSLIVWIIAVLIFGGAVWGFAHGAGQEELGPKLGWMLGSLAVICLEVFVAVKLNAVKKK